MILDQPIIKSVNLTSRLLSASVFTIILKILSDINDIFKPSF